MQYAEMRELDPHMSRSYRSRSLAPPTPISLGEQGWARHGLVPQGQRGEGEHAEGGSSICQLGLEGPWVAPSWLPSRGLSGAK